MVFRVLARLRRVIALRPVPPTSVGPGPVFNFPQVVFVGEDIKAYKTYAEQVEILAGRGMDMGDRLAAVEFRFNV